MTTIASIPLLSGSVRPKNNCTGLAAFLISRWNEQISKHEGMPSIVPAEDLMPSGLPLPIGPFESEQLSHVIFSPDQYESKAVQEWSKIVSAAPAVVIVTPQYNRGVPGHLKNVLDQLFNEWKSKPVFVIAYGGHGGGQCANQLTNVLVNGLNAVSISDPLLITLPKEYIREDRRLKHNGSIEEDSFLEEYKEPLDLTLSKLITQIHSSTQ